MTEQVSAAPSDLYPWQVDQWQQVSQMIQQQRLPHACLLYTSPSPRDEVLSRMPSSA